MRRSKALVSLSFGCQSRWSLAGERTAAKAQALAKQVSGRLSTLVWDIRKIRTAAKVP